jgi:hypothetical protein
MNIEQFHLKYWLGDKLDAATFHNRSLISLGDFFKCHQFSLASPEQKFWGRLI